MLCIQQTPIMVAMFGISADFILLSFLPTSGAGVT